MCRYRLCLLALALVAASSPLLARDLWMRVQLDGRKIGSLLVQRVERGDTVRTVHQMDIELDRVGSPLRLHNHLGSVETRTGKVLAFDTRTRLSRSSTEVRGRRQADGRFLVHTHTAGGTRTSMLSWPEGALLLEGQRLAILAHGMKPGTHYRMTGFDPASRTTTRMDMQVIGPRRAELPDGVRSLTLVRQTLHRGAHTQTMELWLDSDGTVLKGRLPLLGFSMEMLACSRACATAPNQRVDLLRETMVESPRPIPAAYRAGQMRYVFRVGDGTAATFPDTDEQQVQALGRGYWRVDIGRAHPRAGQEPRPSDTEATDWLQADAPLIRSLARRAAGDAHSRGQQLHNMNRFVHDFIARHNLDVGYGSALETARTREGDCTEHAVLLAAMARAQEIPARVVSGLVYADRYGGRRHVFVPHAWVQAWVDGRWRSFDPTLGRFDSTHVALAVGDGDPWRHFESLELLGKLRLVRVTPTGQVMDLLPGPGGDPGGGR
jgi:hypothetical protein